MVTSKPIVAAIGNFDGVHQGHQFLLKETERFAHQQDAALGVVLFDPHPRRFFRPDDDAFLLTTPEQRDRLLGAVGVQKIFVLNFDDIMSSMSPEGFVRDILKEKLNLAGVVAGADFRFGAGREGDGDALRALGKEQGMKVKLVDVLDEGGGEKFGSSGVREALKSGDVARATDMLGRPWSVRGVVAEGRKVGRTIGFPTTNLTLGALVEPRKGVYATTVDVDGVVYNAVSNFGRRPTVGSDAPLLETYLFDFDGDLYGREIEVSFVAFIRDERKFDGLEPLKAQIADDCIKARELLR